MACINMFNSDQQQGFCTSMGPRISFSSDFADTQQANKRENSYTEAPVSSDFEFSVSNYTMNSADDLFSRGKLVPLKENKVTTLRDELLVGDEDEVVFPRVPKNSGWWKEKLGLRRSNQNVGKKGGDQKSGSDGGGLGRIDETKKAIFVHELYYANMTGLIDTKNGDEPDLARALEYFNFFFSRRRIVSFYFFPANISVGRV